MKNASKRAEELLAECETGEEVTELLAGLIDLLAGIKKAAEIQIAHMEALDDDGELARPDYVADFLQETIYEIEENLA